MADFETMSGAERRCVRQGQSIKAKEDRAHSSHADWSGGSFRVGNKKAADGADSQSGDDPTGRAEDTDRAEILAGVLHLAESESVGESHGRHVKKRIDEKDRVHGPEMSLGGGEPEEDAADAVENGEQALIGKEFIGHQSNEKGRHNGTNGGGAADDADLIAGG